MTTTNPLLAVSLRTRRVLAAGGLTLMVAAGLTLTGDGAALANWVKLKRTEIGQQNSIEQFVSLDDAVRLQFWTESNKPWVGISLRGPSALMRSDRSGTVTAARNYMIAAQWMKTEPDVGESFIRIAAISTIRLNCPTADCHAQVELSRGPTVVITNQTTVATLKQAVQDKSKWLLIDKSGTSTVFVSLDKVQSAELRCQSTVCTAIITLEPNRTFSLFEKDAVDQVKDLMPEVGL